MAIRQTPDGYLWLSSRGGLLRFDGFQFKTFNRVNTPALKGTNFTAFGLTVDREGGLWAATWGAGAVRYFQGHFTSYTTRDGLLNNSVVRIDEDDRGRIWIFTYPGVSIWENGTITKFAPAPDCGLNEYLKAPSNLGIDPYLLGLWRFENKVWQRFAYGQWSNVPMPSDIAQPAKVQLDSLMEDSSHRIWFKIVGRPTDVFSVKNGQLQIFRGLPNGSFACYQDRLGRLWITDHDGHTGFWHKGAFTHFQGLSTPSRFHVFEDRDHEFWVGTLNQGLFRLTRQSVTMLRSPGAPAVNAVGTVLQDRSGDIWVGSRGLTRLKGGLWSTFLRKHTPAPWFDAQTTGSMFADTNGDIWAGFPDEVTLFRNGRFVPAPPALREIDSEINVMHRDRSGDLWLGGDGLYRFGKSRLQRYTEADGAAVHDVRVLLADQADGLWVASDDGLSLFQNGRFTTWREKDGLSSNHLLALHKDKAGVLWIGTADAGLNRFENGRFTRLTSLNGLAFDDIYQIFEDQAGFLWLTSRRGISRVLKRELNDIASGRATRVAALQLGKADGLTSIDCRGHGQPRGFQKPDGTLMIPTADGIAVLNPNRIPLDRRAPPVLIEECRLNHRPIDFKDGLRIGPGSSEVEIQYTALNFTRANQTRFKYRLTGLDTQWTDAATSRSVSYSHLPPGSYTFQVIAANSDGVWNMRGQSLSVVVLPPVYRTWWFLSLALVSICLAAWFTHRHRVGLVEKKQAAQESFARQLLSTQEAERRRIAAELHDSLGQRLAMIRNWALLGTARLAGQGSAPNELEEISDVAGSALSEVREIAYNLGPVHLDHLGVSKAIRSMARRVEQAFAISITMELEELNGGLSRDAEINLFRISQEALNNVAKHSGASQASIVLQQLKGQVKLVVTDNGKGFDTASNRTGFGLIGIAERVRLLHGNLNIQSSPGEGTALEITIPEKSS